MHATAAAHNTAQATEEDAAKGGGSFPDVETLPKSSDSAEAGMMCQICAQGVGDDMPTGYEPYLSLHQSPMQPTVSQLWRGFKPPCIAGQG